MLITEINNPPADGHTFLLHINKEGQAVMYRVGAGGKLGDMATGTAIELLTQAVKEKFPEASINPNSEDRVDPRTKCSFGSWRNFCEAYSQENTEAGAVARYIWLATNLANGFCRLNGEVLEPTERALKADAKEVIPEQPEEKKISSARGV
jgi:hypothetical protein